MITCQIFKFWKHHISRSQAGMHTRGRKKTIATKALIPNILRLILIIEHKLNSCTTQILNRKQQQNKKIINVWSAKQLGSAQEQIMQIKFNVLALYLRINKLPKTIWSILTTLGKYEIAWAQDPIQVNYEQKSSTQGNLTKAWDTLDGTMQQLHVRNKAQLSEDK
jgi:hypothetical protein